MSWLIFPLITSLCYCPADSCCGTCDSFTVQADSAHLFGRSSFVQFLLRSVNEKVQFVYFVHERLLLIIILAVWLLKEVEIVL